MHPLSHLADVRNNRARLTLILLTASIIIIDNSGLNWVWIVYRGSSASFHSFYAKIMVSFTIIGILMSMSVRLIDLLRIRWRINPRIVPTLIAFVSILLISISLYISDFNEPVKWLQWLVISADTLLSIIWFIVAVVWIKSLTEDYKSGDKSIPVKLVSEASKVMGVERKLSQNRESVASNEGDLGDRSRLRKIMLFFPGMSLVMGVIALVLCILSGKESALNSLLLTAAIFQTVFSILSLGATFIFKRRPVEFVRSGMLACGLVSSLMVGLFALEALLKSTSHRHEPLDSEMYVASILVLISWLVGVLWTVVVFTEGIHAGDWKNTVWSRSRET